MNEELEKKIYKRTQRLQGPEWHKKKDRLFMVGHKIHNNNTDGGIRVKGFYKDIDKDGILYTHWMNNHEIAEFLLSFESDESPVFKENYEEHTVYALQFAVMRKQIDMLSKSLIDIKQHIKDKVRKSFEVDWGISDKRSDRLFTETIIELQIIEQMINDALEKKGE